jgi:hypothetical protein
MGAEDSLLGLIPVAIEAKIITNILDTKQRKKNKKSKGLTFD